LLQQDSKAQVTALHLIVGTLQRMHVFGVENRDTLTHKATGVNPIALFCYN
jgi:vacuolar protein sorting-associated protein 35